MIDKKKALEWLNRESKQLAIHEQESREAIDISVKFMNRGDPYSNMKRSMQKLQNAHNWHEKAKRRLQEVESCIECMQKHGLFSSDKLARLYAEDASMMDLEYDSDESTHESDDEPIVASHSVEFSTVDDIDDD